MPNILIVEDHPESLDYLSTLLGYHEYGVICASSAVEGMAAARRKQPDLVITDVLMPECDGYEFTRMLRAEASTAQIPIIFWTASYGQRGSAILLAENFGVECVLAKPTEPEELLNAVSRVLKRTERKIRPAVTPELQHEHTRMLTNHLFSHEQELESAGLRLQVSEAQYRALFEGNPQPMWVIDAATSSFLAVNEAALNLFEFTRHEFSEHDADWILVAGGVGIERRFRTKGKGEIIATVARQAIVFDSRPSWAETIVDITERCRAEEKLRIVSDRLRALEGSLTAAAGAGGPFKVFADELKDIADGLVSLTRGSAVKHRGRTHS